MQGMPTDMSKVYAINLVTPAGEGVEGIYTDINLAVAVAEQLKKDNKSQYRHYNIEMWNTNCISSGKLI